jgi:hypothetical protein
MRFPARLVACSAAFGLLSSTAHAWHFEVRFIERVGNTDVVLPGNSIDASDGTARNIRIQMGVFDDGNGAAPAGGFLGWVGEASLSVSGPINNSDERRNPGRLAPFNGNNSSNANGSPPLPGGDPFTTLTLLDVALNLQALPWTCNPDGTPAPQPEAVVRGRNTFVSIYAFSVDPNANAVSYSVTAAGRLYAALEWRQAPTTQAPECSDPQNPVPGHADYFPLASPNQLFSSTLNVVVPAPSAGLAGALGVLAVASRRRRR